MGWLRGRRVAAVAGCLSVVAGAGLGGSLVAASASPVVSAAAGQQVLSAAEMTAAAQAASSGKPVSVPDLTTEYSEVEARPDGTFGLTTHRSPVRVKRASGWVPIDTQLSVGADGLLRPKAALDEVAFSGGGSSPLVTISRGATSLALTWPTALPEPTITGNKATYANVLPDVDLQVIALADTYSEVLVVKNRVAAANPALAQLRLGVQSVGLRLSQRADGSSEAVDDNGSSVFHAPAPTMWDSTTDAHAGAVPSASESGPSPQRIPSTLSPSASAAAGRGATRKSELALTPPVSALTGPEVTYPLYLDPAYGGGRVNFVVVRSTNQNYYGGSDVLRVGYCAWSGCNPYSVARSFFDLDTSTIRPRATTARIFSAAVYVNEIWNASGCTAQPVNLHASTGPIDAGTSWGGPAGGALQTVYSNSGGSGACPANNVTFDNGNVVNYVQQAANNGWPTLTFGLLAPDEGNAYQWKKFDNNPSMYVTYSFPPPRPPASRSATRSTAAAPSSPATPNPPSMPAPSTTTPAPSHPTCTSRSTARPATWPAVRYGLPPARQVHGRSPSHSQTAPTGTASKSTTTPANRTTPGPATGSLPTSKSTLQRLPRQRVSSFDYPQGDATGANYGAPAGMSSPGVPVNGPSMGSITLTGDSSRVAGFAYSWNSSTVPALVGSSCAATATYNNPDGTASGGLIVASNGVATLPVPPNLLAGPHTLYVRAYDNTHNLSAVTTGYSLRVAPWSSTATPSATRLEAEDINPVTDVLHLSRGALAWPRSKDNQRHFTATGSGQSFVMPFMWHRMATTTSSCRSRSASHYGIMQFEIDGSPLYDANTGAPFQIDGFSAV